MKSTNLQTGLLACLLCYFITLPAFPQEVAEASGQAKFVLADKIRLLQFKPESERPCFRFRLNIDTQDGKDFELSAANIEREIDQQLRIFDDGEELDKYHFQVASSALKRYTIILLDHSGSMWGQMDSHRTKYEIAKDASHAFANDFVDGVDYVAVIPFSDLRSIGRIRRANFISNKSEVLATISRLKMPDPNALTGLYSAMYAAMLRLSKVRKHAKKNENYQPQCLIVVLTDGKNQRGEKGVNRRLMGDRDLTKVIALADTTGIQIFTIGFGNGARDFDEGVLRSLAWPTAANYKRAKDSRDLINAFKRARRFQLQQIKILLLPNQNLREELVQQHRFTIQLNAGGQGNLVEGTFPWTPPVGMLAPPFEGVLTEKERNALIDAIKAKTGNGENPIVEVSFIGIYFALLIIIGALLYLFWRVLPKKIWAKEYDAHILYERAVEATRHDSEGTFQIPSEELS